VKVYIGNWKNFIGPYQIADLLSYVGVSEDSCTRVGEYLSGTPISKVCQWVDEKRKRKVKVKLHDYDCWNLDTTLAYIILPTLIKFKANHHGCPFVDDDDVPSSLRSDNAKVSGDDGSWDSNNEYRWEWIIDELIWTFTQIHGDSDWESQYHHGVIDFNFKKVEGSDCSQLVSGPLHTHTFDKEGYTKHNERIDNGLRLFGRYYRSLWD